MSNKSKALLLREKSCQPCHSGTPPLSEDEARRLLQDLDHWRLADEGKSIRREFEARDFAAGIEFVRRVGEVAEQEDHHPDLHLTNYRKVAIQLSTHAIGGLSENDFILAAKIDALPVALKKKNS